MSSLTNTKLTVPTIDGGAASNLSIQAYSTTIITVDGSNERVGIGTASPSAKFHCVADTNDTVLIRPYQTLTADPSDLATGGVELCLSRPDDGIIQTKIFTYNNAGNSKNQTGFNTRSDYVFLHNGVERVRFLENGNVGIGTDSPSYTLNVFGTSGFRNYTTDWVSGYAIRVEHKQDESGNYGILILNAANSGIEGRAINFTNYAGTIGGYVGHRGDNGVVSYNTGSDIRLKKNFEYEFNSLDIIQNVKPVWFNWNTEEDTASKDIGFIAQELNQVYPIAVKKGEKEEDYWCVDYLKLIPVLTKAIQELKAGKDALEARIAALEV